MSEARWVRSAPGELLVLLALLLCGCATPGPALTTDVSGLRTGVTAAKQQADDGFTAANDLARQQAVARKIALPETILREEDFPVPVSAAAAAKWDGAFDILDQYAAALESLVDARNSRATGNAIGALGEALNASPAVNARIPASLTAIFATFGEALVQASAERKAGNIMRLTDPAFQHVINGMATAIGDPGAPGALANDVASQWNNSVLPMLENEYGALAPTDFGQRQKVLAAYTQAMASRDRELNDLALLRRSLVALGEAHHAAAMGKPADALFWVQRINSWADDVRTRMAPEDPKK